MSYQSQDNTQIEDVWREMLTEGDLDRRMRRIFRLFPGEPQCKQCYAPLNGFGASLVNLIWHKGPSKMNPHYCNDCEVFAQEHLGGAEVELALLFADVRGSTGMAE